MKKASVLSVLVLLIMAILAVGCVPARQAGGVVGNVIAERDEIVRLHGVAQRESANFQLAVDTEYAKIQATTAQTGAYYDAVQSSGEVWTGNFEAESQAMTEMLQAYQAEYGSLPPEALNLAQMQEQGLLPDNLGSGFALYVNSVVQAPPPVPDSAVTLSLMATTSESMETIRAAGAYWNAAATDYNNYRQKVSSEALAAASQLLGFPLPGTLPLYQGGNAGQPVQNPIATP